RRRLKDNLEIIAYAFVEKPTRTIANNHRKNVIMIDECETLITAFRMNASPIECEKQMSA
ncbi:MAG: hypothetical protein COW08_03495, partial [Ignavibacteriales bacterium CG12_big_fil_rev_8_21_14_0_65_30_8]